MKERLKLLKLLLLSLTRRNLIYQVALHSIGTDVSPDDLAPDELGCAESVTNILNKTVGTPIMIGTWTLNDYLNRSSKWKPVTEPMAGDVVISPTGMGGAGKSGHTGIVGLNGVIMSNNSFGGVKGKWTANYTVDAWKARFKTFPVYFYRLA